MSDLRGPALVAVGLLGVLACYWGLLYLLQRAVLFPRPIAAGGTAGLERAGGEQVWLAAPLGRVEAWLLPAAPRSQPRRPLVLFAPGNGELIDHWVDELAPLRAWGIAVRRA